MGIPLVWTKPPSRLVFVPQPIALRYLARDDKGLIHICQRTCPQPGAREQGATQPPVPAAPLPS